jgi:hypothetical protein
MAPPHRIDRPARPVGSGLPANQLARPARGGVPAVPTRLVADALNNTAAERVAVTAYGLTLLAIHLLESALDAYARHEHLYAPRDDGEEPLIAHRKLLPVVIRYVIAILIGLAVPGAAVALYLGITVYLIVPFREVARLLSRRL